MVVIAQKDVDIAEIKAMTKRRGSKDGRVPRAFQTQGEPPQPSPIQSNDQRTKMSERFGDSSSGASREKQHFRKEQFTAQKESGK